MSSADFFFFLFSRLNKTVQIILIKLILKKKEKAIRIQNNYYRWWIIVTLEYCFLFIFVMKKKSAKNLSDEIIIETRFLFKTNKMYF